MSLHYCFLPIVNKAIKYCLSAVWYIDIIWVLDLQDTSDNLKVCAGR